MTRPLALEFVKSATRPDDLPEGDVPEAAIVGRSNVGKSSLINALSNRKSLAKVSKTPGRTQLLNYFVLTDGARRDPIGAVVDLPGYGFAKVPARIKAGWQAMIEGYLLEREQLQMVLVLVDGEVGPTALDLAMLDWLRSHMIPHSVVATKHDKVKAAVRTKRKRELAEKCHLEQGDVVWTSAEKNVGIDVLRSRLITWLDLE
ncbi:MAG: ribosome biogenesis GTP-binding protein YihA/YsxC [Microthrixaceae bacterium]